MIVRDRAFHCENRGVASPITKPGVIDLVTHDQKTDEYALVLVETRKWEEGREQLEQLQGQLQGVLGPQLWETWEKGRNLQVNLDP